MMDAARRSGASPPAVSAATWHGGLSGEGPDGRMGTHAGFAIREFSETPAGWSNRRWRTIFSVSIAAVPNGSNAVTARRTAATTLIAMR